MPQHDSPRWIDGHGLVLEPAPGSRDDALAAARAHLLAGGADAWDVDEVLASRHVRVERVWWSDIAGFVHPGHEDGRLVVMVLGLTPPPTEA